MAADTTLRVIGSAEIAVPVTQLIVGQEVRPAVRQDLPVQEVRMHVRLDGVVDHIFSGGELQLPVRSPHGKFLRTGCARARVDWIKDVGGETALVAAIFKGEFCTRQPGGFQGTGRLSKHVSSLGGRRGFLVTVWSRTPWILSHLA